MNGEPEAVVSWLKFVADRLSWNDAAANCAEMGGKLFSNVDGSTDQLNFLTSEMDDMSFWLGIYTEDEVHWKTVDGKIVDSSLILWGSHQPQLSGEYYAAILAQEGNPG